MNALQFLPGILAAIGGVLLTMSYQKNKRPLIAVTAGFVFLFAIVWFWRCFFPAPEHHPFMR